MNAYAQLLQVLCERLDFVAGALWLAEADTSSLQCVEVWSRQEPALKAFLTMTHSSHDAPDSALLERIRQHGQPVWIGAICDEAEFRRGAVAEHATLAAAALVPVRVGLRTAGVIELYATAKRAPDSGLTELLGALGDQIGQFLGRLEQQQRIERLSRVHAVLRGINSALVRIHDRRALFHEACRIAVEHGNFGIVWIGEYDSITQTVQPVAWAGIDDTLGACPIDLRSLDGKHRSLVARAIRQAKPVYINDFSTDVPTTSGRAAEAQRRGYRSAIVLPLSVESAVSGVLAIYAHEAGFFSAGEIELLTSLASDVSFGLTYIARRERLTYLAHYDVLTGLPNRTLWLERLTHVLHAQRNSGERIGIVVGDIARFRHVNDCCGRETGDELLRILAKRLVAAWPLPEHVARLSGDRFGGIVAGLHASTEIAELLERTLPAVLERPIVIGNDEFRPMLATGSAVFPDDGTDAETLLRHAEAALGQAKASGQRNLSYRPALTAQITDALRLEQRLRRAVEREEFVLHYQPKIEVTSRRIAGFEALLRWQDPESGLIPPDRFIPVLEATGLIVEVGQWVIRQALADSAAWRRDGIEVPPVAVNVSSVQMQSGKLATAMQSLFEQSGAVGQKLDLEITESLIMSDVDAHIPVLAGLRRQGMSIAVDDFGTGYSSLAYLAQLPVDALKIDRSFVATMLVQPESHTIVATIISLAHALGLKVIAEGVETDTQARRLADMGCDEWQGYLFSRPLPPAQMREFLRIAGAAGGV